MQNLPSQRSLYEQKYKSSRYNLLLIVVFTVINMFLLVTNANSYFLFSAYVPYFTALMGMTLCGRLAPEYYPEEYGTLYFLDDSVFFILLAVAIALTALYLLAWFMSNKQRVGWLIFALVFFSVDTVAMVLLSGISYDSIFDIVFHGWVIYSLVSGIVAHSKLKKLPPEGIVIPADMVSPVDMTISGEPAAASILNADQPQEAESAENTQEPNS